MTMKRRKSRSEISDSPVPRRHQAFMCGSGFWISTVYENVATGPLNVPRPRRLRANVIVQLIDGCGFYWTERGGMRILRPGQAILASSSVVESHGGYYDRFVEDSVSFSGPMAKALEDSGVFREGVVSIGHARRLLPIIKMQRKGSREAMLEANSMLLSLIFELAKLGHDESSQESDDLKTFETLNFEMRRDWQRIWRIKDICEFCRCTERGLRRIIGSHANCSPKMLHDKLKMEKAKELLLSAGMPVKEVADSLGFADQYHFMRRFAKLEGVSPARYRSDYLARRSDSDGRPPSMVSGAPLSGIHTPPGIPCSLSV